MTRKDKAKKAAYERAWRAANPERYAAIQRKWKTGWAQEQYDEKLCEQGHRCGICGVNQCSSGRAFSADHCHTTGKPRGVLCGNCNRGLGLLGDNAAGVLKAAAYLLKYEVETKWEPITNDKDTINTGATDHTQNIQSTDERGGHDIRDVAPDNRSSHRAPALALVRGARLLAG
jgi:hypothetical protein